MSGEASDPPGAQSVVPRSNNKSFFQKLWNGELFRNAEDPNQNNPNQRNDNNGENESKIGKIFKTIKVRLVDSMTHLEPYLIVGVTVCEIISLFGTPIGLQVSGSIFYGAYCLFLIIWKRQEWVKAESL